MPIGSMAFRVVPETARELVELHRPVRPTGGERRATRAPAKSRRAEPTLTFNTLYPRAVMGPQRGADAGTASSRTGYRTTRVLPSG
jgi:hypothetical protein